VCNFDLLCGEIWSVARSFATQAWEPLCALAWPNGCDSALDGLVLCVYEVTVCMLWFDLKGHSRSSLYCWKMLFLWVDVRHSPWSESRIAPRASPLQQLQLNQSAVCSMRDSISVHPVIDSSYSQCSTLGHRVENTSSHTSNMVSSVLSCYSPWYMFSDCRIFLLFSPRSP
jgi:hypothetical protein